jgi:hypothetical protein
VKIKEPPVLCILKTESTNHCCRYFKKSESKNWPVLGIQNPQRMLVFVKEPHTLPNSLTFKIVFGLIPKVISVTSCKSVAGFKAAQHGFPRTGSAGPRANRHRNMSCFGGGSVPVSAGQKPHALEHEP